MATYKKKYKPEGKKEANQIDESEFETAGVLNTLDETASKSEKWIEKNSKPLFYGLVLIAVVIFAYLGYNKYIIEPTEKEASNELSFPRKHFNEANNVSVGVDSLLNLGLDGADGKYGFVDIANTYSGTSAGNLANYYAGLSYLKLKQYDKAVDYLSKFSSDDLGIGPVALGAIGDAFADINQFSDAVDYYVKATKKENNYTTPLYLFKAAQLSMNLKEYSNALSYFQKIKSDFPTSFQAGDIDKYISSAEFAAKN